MIAFLILPYAFSLTPEEANYFDSQNQKTVAQINSKIDSQVTKVQTDFKNELDIQKGIIKQEITTDVKNAMKSMTIGIFGIMLVTLAVFRIIELRLSHNKNIIRYEKLLKDEVKIFGEQQAELKRYKESLDLYRDELLKQAKQMKIQTKPIEMKSSITKQPFNVRALLLVIGIILSLVIIGAVIYIKVVLKWL